MHVLMGGGWSRQPSEVFHHEADSIARIVNCSTVISQRVGVIMRRFANLLHGRTTTERLTQVAQFLEAGRLAEAIGLANTVRSDPQEIEEKRQAAQRLIDHALESTAAPREPTAETQAYGAWYYNRLVFMTTKYLGVPVWKSATDLWNYQEIITQFRPPLVIEFGTFCGGSALFFAKVLENLGISGKIFTVDADHTNLDPRVADDKSIEVRRSSSTDPSVGTRIAELRAEYVGPAFAILDSDHRKEHVLAEMMLLRPLLRTGDYLVVEDGCVNGHPVHPGWGEGPFEAIEAYFQVHSDDYVHDVLRERKFGFTFAPNGFLRRL
jgi:cephalosporin hydroxylase